MLKTLKPKVYILEIILIILLFFTLFVPNAITARVLIAIIIPIFTLIFSILIKKQDIIISYKKEIIIEMIGFGVIYISINYLLAIYFGLYRNYESFTLERVMLDILPIISIIFFSEILRFKLLDQNKKYSKILVFIIMVLIDICVYWQMYDISQLNGFLDIVGTVIFVSIASNLLYNYISVRYGFKPIIIYRLITTLYLYIMPFLPNIYDFLEVMIGLIYPYLIYLFLEYLYTKKKKIETSVNKKRRIVNIIIIVVIAIFIVLIISCRFYIGIISVGSESMTGAIDKGDAVVFIKYTNQEIEKGDIIIFTKNNSTVVHRVVDIVEVRNEIRYYTKGDMNETEDSGYITDEDIVGISKFKIKYIGYPTIWINDIFS